MGEDNNEKTLLLVDNNNASESALNQDGKAPPDNVGVSTPRQWIILSTLLLLHFVSIVVDGFCYPFFTERAFGKGLRQLQVGVIFSAYDFSRFAGSTVVYSWVCEKSPRKLFLVIGVLSSLLCVSFGLSDLAPDGLFFFLLCVGIRLAAGVGSGLLTTLCTSVLLKSTSFNPSTIMAAMESTVASGFGVGPALGSLLYKMVGYVGSFMPLGGVTLLCTVIAFVAVPANVVQSENVRTDNSASNSKQISYLQFMLIPGILIVFLSLYMLKFVTQGITIFISDFVIHEFDMDYAIIGVLFLVSALLCTICSHISAKLTTTLGLLWSQVIVSWLFIVACLLLLPPSPFLNFIFKGERYEGLTVAMYLVNNIAQAGIWIPALQISLDLVRQNGLECHDLRMYGMVSGMIHGGISLAAGTAPLVAGAITQLIDFDWLCTISSMLSLMTLIIIICFVIWEKSRTKGDSEESVQLIGRNDKA